ncbi:MAG TPA: flagellin [Alphaproteobacteria bacterium]
MAGQNSINTNVGALVALRNLVATNTELERVQNRVSTGLRVIGAQDNASIFAIAQGIRGDIKATAAVQQGLSQGKGISSVALSGATQVSNLLQDIKAKIVEGMNPANTSEQQTILNADYAELVKQALSFIQNAEYNGQNLLKSGATTINVISDVSGGTLRVRSQDLEGTAYSQLNAQNLANVTAASAALTQVNTVINTVNTALGQLGADDRALGYQDTFLTTISDALDEGLGALVDADLAKESARLQALQVKQQLAVQTLSIANSSPQILLGLFQ